MNGSSAVQALQGKRIAVLGCGVNNRHLVAWLARQNLDITVRDSKLEAKESFEKDFPGVEGLRWEIVPSILDNIQQFDVLVRTPAIPFHTPELMKAYEAGISITSQTKLFFQLAPCELIGVTGSKGKGTTSTLIANILKSGRKEGKTYLAGNIGLDPFSFVDDLTEEDIVVLELSSFQLTDLHMSPQVAVVLHVVPEHLDHHRTEEAYREAKRQLLAHQRSNDLAVVNGEYSDMAVYLESVQGQLLRYTRHIPQKEAAWVENLDGKEVAFIQIGGGLESIDITGRRLLGDHNLENILPAILVGLHYKISPLVIQKEVVQFAGLEHRLSHVGTYNGVAFYDDSIATTPESCMVAMEAFAGRRIHLLCGGKTKGQDFTEVANAMVERCATISLLPGAGTPELEKLIKKTMKLRRDCECTLLTAQEEPLMETVISGIHPHLMPGDVVLLSPAAASDGPFKNYKERGDAFVKAVKQRYEEQE